MSCCRDCMNYSVCDDEDKDCSICDAYEKGGEYMSDYIIVPGRGKVSTKNSDSFFSMISNTPKRRETPYERTKAQVYATGNKWAIENFHATHD